MIFAYGLFVKDKDGFLQPYTEQGIQSLVYSKAEADELLEFTLNKIIEDVLCEEVNFVPKWIFFTKEIITKKYTSEQRKELLSIRKKLQICKIKVVALEEK